MAIGTPAYMSPEQAGGLITQVGPQSDVYSLGATLYCLLTGRPPQEAPDVEEMLGRTQRGEVTPPRQINPCVPRALEAIAMKAMALKPDDRYKSARALADDVERWLADEPVTAWRDHPLERARRWMRHRRTTVAVMGVSVLAALVGLAAVLAVSTQANRALTAANLDLMVANRIVKSANASLAQANRREQARFDLAVSAIKTFYTGVSEDVLLKEKQFDGLRAKLLGGATEFYRRLEEMLRVEADRRSRAALGQAFHDVGELTSKIGSQPEALVALRRGLELRRALAISADAASESKLELGQSLVAIGDVLEATGDVNGARSSYEEARDLLQPLAELETTETSYRALVAKTLQGIGRTTYHAGEAAAALAFHEQARSIREALAAANPSLTELQSDLAGSYDDIGWIHRASGRAADALAAYQRALGIRQTLKGALGDRASTQVQSDLAESHQHIGILLHETGQHAKALASLERGRAILQELSDANPAVSQFQGELAQCYQVIGSVYYQTGRAKEAISSYERARAIFEKLVAANPTVTLFQTRLAMSRAYAGQVRQRERRPAQAAAEYRRAAEIVEHVSQQQPNGYNLYNLACYKSLLAGVAVLPDSGLTPADAERLGDQAVEALRRAVAAGFRDFDFMRRDTDLDAVRSRADFQMLLLDLAFPAEAFAPLATSGKS
jgi:serine/threonine-protein kinase